MDKQQPYQIKTISGFHKLLGLPKPEHPLISVIEIMPFEEIPPGLPESCSWFLQHSIKKEFQEPCEIQIWAAAI